MSVRAAFLSLAKSRLPFDSLEELVESPLGFGLTTITPVQRAVCRLISGQPLGDLSEEPDVVESLGGAGHLGRTDFNEVIVCAAVRSAKSLLASALAIWASQVVDLAPATSSGDIARFSIASIELDNARVIVEHLVGALERPGVRGRYISHEDLRDSSEIPVSGITRVGSFYVLHPTGRPIEIRVVAGKRAGGSLVSRWSAGCVLDEAPRMVGSESGVVNYDDMRRAVLGRLLPGAVLFSIGSPWARTGPIYDVVQSEWGRPVGTRIVLKARGPQMNPFWWTPERCAWLRDNDPDAYQTDVLAEFLDEAESLYPDALIGDATRESPETLPFDDRAVYSAYMDPGVSRNSWTFAISAQMPERHNGVWSWKKKVVFTKEWVGTKSKRNNPGEILSEVAGYLEQYGLEACFSDQWGWDGFAVLAMERGFSLLLDDATPKEKTQQYLDLAVEIKEGKVEFSPSKMARRDLILVKKLRKGGLVDVKIVLPETADGRHCDFAPSIVGSLATLPKNLDQLPPPEGTSEREQWEAIQRQEKAAEFLEQEQNKQWWELD